MNVPVFRRPHAAQIGAAAREVTQRPATTLTLVRHRAQPTAVTVVRLTSTAIFAYLLALLLTTTSRPVLAPLTALLVVQVSLYQTVRSALTKVTSVVAGVLLAVALSAWVGFTWWSLAITIAVGLAAGYVLHLGENVPEVPISAMLILSVGTRAAGIGRIEETFIGAGAGLVAGFVLASPQIQTAEEAIGDLCGKLGDLLDRMAAGLSEGSVMNSAGDWLRQARSVGGEVRRVDDALRQAEESVRLNPRSLRLPLSPVTLRQALETLEHEATTIRLLCRSLADGTRLLGDENPVGSADTRDRLAGLLRELSAAIRAYGSLATEHDTQAHQRLEAELERHLDAARGQQGRLGTLLRTDPADDPAGWPLRGELIGQLDRIRTELEMGRPAPRGPQRRARWRPTSRMQVARLPRPVVRRRKN